MSFSLIQILAISFLISGSASLIITTVFSKTTAKSTIRNDTSAVQAAHTRPTPRIGGLAIVLGLVAASLILFIFGHPELPCGTHFKRFTSFCCWSGRGSG